MAARRGADDRLLRLRRRVPRRDRAGAVRVGHLVPLPGNPEVTAKRLVEGLGRGASDARRRESITASTRAVASTTPRAPCPSPYPLPRSTVGEGERRTARTPAILLSF